jgi:osmotically-inducible protein OsmY
LRLFQKELKMNQRFDHQRESRPNSAGRNASRERESEGRQRGNESPDRHYQQGSFDEGRSSRYGQPRPEERYGANNEYPGPGTHFDGSEYEWRGEQAGRGGRQDYWRGEQADRGREDSWRADQGMRGGRGDYYFNQPGNRQNTGGRDTFGTDNRPARNTGRSLNDSSYGSGQSGMRNSGDEYRMPESMYGQFAGRGPKGYKRSDERIREDINEQLTRHPDVDASEIEVQVQEGQVTLSGTVNERHCKRMAEDIAEGISGVQDVRNEIRVQRTGASGSDSNMSADQNRSGGAQDRGATSKAH